MKFWKLLLPFEKIPILVIALLILTLISFQALNALRRKKVLGILSDTILFLGFLSLSWGIFVQIYNLILGARAATRAADLNPLMIRQGLQITLVPIFLGLITLLVSAIVWYVLRAYRNNVR